MTAATTETYGAYTVHTDPVKYHTQKGVMVEYRVTWNLGVPYHRAFKSLRSARVWAEWMAAQEEYRGR